MTSIVGSHCALLWKAIMDKNTIQLQYAEPSY